MENKFTEIMSKRSNEQLIKIVTVDSDGYEALAIEAAKKEIDNRQLDVSAVEALITDVTDAHEAEKTIEANKAPSIIRLLNVIVDTIAYLMLFLISGFIVSLFSKTTPHLFLRWMAPLVLLFSYLAYYIILESLYQQTLGKYMTKTKVVMVNGQKATTRDIVSRTIFRIIPFDFISFLFSRSGFHDRLSGTIVIKEKQG